MTGEHRPPGTDRWLASDSRWYPPQAQLAAGWWLASDGRWYHRQEDRSRPQRLAVASLVCGLAGMFIMTAFVAVGLGIATLAEARRSKERHVAHRLMAIVGILAGGFWLYLASVVNW
jgi:uncharacterized membrane protein